MFSNFKNVLSEIYLLLTPKRKHGFNKGTGNKVFEKIAIIGFRRTKSLKDILV